MVKRLEGKVALVTGCGSSGPGWGNGKAMAVLFAREGAEVYGCDINLDAARETEVIVREEGGAMSVAQCDVTDAGAVEALVQDCIATYGDIDILVNNVGTARLGGVVEQSLEDWRLVFDINLTSMFLTCKHVIPSMLRKARGSIVNIGSVAGVRDSGVAYVSYSASKAAVLGFSRSVALEYAKRGIRSNVLMPGLMNTPMVRQPLLSLADGYREASLEETMAKRDRQCPMGHMGEAWDVAYTALRLASDESKYVTSAEIMVDGGISARIG
ncbi:SDR family NAD(P)-dependent oxidoreductase [Hydrogenophaga taeniospiralis]|uniref:SDR family NAD(P)-dependent oxidoreductase n=1 Tax=Hydrogenophaga taeniospiralis TaxID=65656 RepID=UPI001CFBC5C4|nr:SDR family NAD(P)-dependent oxidoreductase [Hydrogenophaga taeniospiralis]UCU93381.1 SDR family oxidoreductase [Hydrogenophaga taeniospiralis]